MSKSKGNYYTLRDLLVKGYDPMAIRYALLSVHYRQQLNFTLEGLKEAEEVIKRLDDCYYSCLSIAALNEIKEVNLASKDQFDKQTELKNSWLKILEALDDNLNISVAFAHLFESLKYINSWFSQQAVDGNLLKGALYFFKLVDTLFGFDIATIDSVPQNVIEMQRRRIELRREKKFDETDQIRKRMSKETGWIAVKDPRPGEPYAIIRKKHRAWDK